VKWNIICIQCWCINCHLPEYFYPTHCSGIQYWCTNCHALILNQ